MIRPVPRKSCPPWPVNLSAATVSSQSSVASSLIRRATGCQLGPTRLREPAGDVFAAGAHSDDDHIELVLAHAVLRDCQTGLLWIGQAHQGITLPGRQFAH